jgi:hypothetical protein
LGIGGIIGGAAGGEAGTVATMAKYTGAAAVGKQVLGAGKNLSWVLVILGIIHYAFRVVSGGNYGMAFIISLGLFVFSGYALSQRMGQDSKDRWAIMFPMLVFVMWYFYFGASYDPMFLAYFLGISFGVMLLLGIVTKGEATKAELLGFLPVLFLFLDIGLIPFLVEKLHVQITPLVQGLVLFMPWWTFFGFLTLPSDASENSSVNFLVNLTKILGILYLVFVIVAPAIPNVGYTQGNLPGSAEFEDAQARLREKLGEKENPAVSNWKCLIAGRFTDLQECINERQTNSELRSICLAEGFEDGSTAYNKCITEQEDIRKQGAPVSGVNDPTIKEPTIVKMVVGQYFPKEMTHDTGKGIDYPVNLEITNPRKQNLTFEFSCNFTNQKNKKENFVGKIVSGEKLDFDGENPKTTVICQSPSDKGLNGSYKLVYYATIKGLTSSSKLQRAFIGDRDEKWKQEWVPKIMSAHFSSNSRLSQGAPDLARINFGYGNTIEDPIVQSKYGQTLSSSIENLGNGKIVNVESYIFDGFQGFGDLGGEGCTSGDKVNLPTSGRSAIPLKTCFTKTMPSDLSNPSVDYVLKEFEATIVYDYLIERSTTIKVNLVTT